MFPAYQPAPHHRLLAEKLEAVERGDIDRLMVFMPPRGGKSELVSVRFPAWYLGRHPDNRVIGTSYAARLAERFSGQARNQLEDPRWPFAVTLADDTASKAAWDIAGHRGGYIAAGVGGPITGSGAHVLIIDDPVKNQEEADSPAYRESVWDWYTSTAYTRLEPGGAVILVMTRWHEDDLAGHLLNEAKEGGDQWEVVRLPARAEDDDALGRQPGEALWPERFPVERLERIRAAIGARAWNALYQQRPTSEEGALFKRQWFQVVDSAPAGLRWVRYWDLAASTKTSADYTASAAVALAEDGTLFIRDMVRGRWEWPDAKRVIRQSMLADAGVEHIVEEALHGLAALQDLRRDPALVSIPLRGVRVTTDKVSRAHSWSARAESGKVALVRGAWVNDFLHEVCSFPNGAHDDQVDTVSGGVEALARRVSWRPV
jgi:predicted phage terminase large subunit-like protein